MPWNKITSCVAHVFGTPMHIPYAIAGIQKLLPLLKIRNAGEDTTIIRLLPVHTLRVHYAHVAANLNSGYSKYAKVARVHYFCTTQQKLANIGPVKISISAWSIKAQHLGQIKFCQRLAQRGRLALGQCVPLLIVGQAKWLQMGQ